MTQPSPPPRTSQRPTDAQIAAVAALIASSATAVGIAAGLATAASIPVAVARALLTLTRTRLPIAALGPAARAMATAEPAYRAAYLVNAAVRVREAMGTGKTLDEAVTAERRFAALHLEAQANRARAAAQVDRMAARTRSAVLGWQATKDARTTPECRAADGKNFSIFAPPLIGLPGMTHPQCRCKAVRAFVGAGFVDGVTGQAATARKAAVA